MDRYPTRPAGDRRRPGSSSPRQRVAALLVLCLAALGSRSALAQRPARPTAKIPRSNLAQSTAQPRTAQAAPRGPQAPPAAGPQRPGAPPAAAQQSPEGPPAAQAPFQLTPEEQADLDRMLQAWEKRSELITLFKCKIKRWEYDKVFGKNTTALGELKYKSPDRGLYRVNDEKSGEPIEDWRCDGKSIYEFNYPKKQLIERVLPPEMQGKAIANGPLPFIFGAKAVTLKQRYFLRLKQPPANQQDKICIEAFPRMQSDAANFQRAELLLTQQGMMPFALQLDLPNGKNITVHQFFDISTNDPVGILMGDFAAPRTPLGWKRIVDDPGSMDQGPDAVTNVPVPGATPPAAPPRQAQGRPAAPRQ